LFVLSTPDFVSFYLFTLPPFSGASDDATANGDDPDSAGDDGFGDDGLGDDALGGDGLGENRSQPSHPPCTQLLS
jgi:hypothetical protein